MYSYTADPAENVPSIVQKNAGRVGGGDFKWTFNNSVDDASSSVDTALKAALVSYKDSIVAIGSGFTDNTDAPQQTEPPAQTTASPEQTTAPPASTNPPTAAGSYVHDFTANGKDSTFYSISGNLSTSKGSVIYAGKTLTQCLKMESATSISFNAGAGGKLTLVFAEAGKTVKVDGTKYTTDANGIVAVELAAGAHSITKGDSINLFYMSYASTSGEPTITTQAPATNPPAQTSVTTQTTTVQPPATSPVIPSGAKVIYCSPNGTGSGTTKEDPTDVKTAVSAVPAGGVIYLLGGTYQFSETIIIDQNNSGTENAVKTISAYPGETVVWDFTGLGEADPSKRGVVLDGSYWHWYGFEITKAADNGMLLSGNHNTIEMMVFNDNQDTGLQVSRYRTEAAGVAEWPSYNLILNCTSRNNCDNATMENADGFAAKLTCGEGNVFDGCLAYNNSDDGWDLYAKEATGPIGVVTIRNSIAFRNGYTEFGEGYGDCDGNGFKLGGAGVGTAHIVENCLAFENLNCGFTDNNNPKLGSLTNCTAFDNSVGKNGKPNFSLYRCTDDGCDFSKVICYVKNQEGKNDKFVGTIENSAYYNGGSYYYVGGKQVINNGDKIGNTVSLTDNDFISLTVGAMGTDFHKEWRNADGTIYTNGFAQTKESSPYVALGAKFYYSDDQPSTEPPATNPPATEPTTEPPATDLPTDETPTDADPVVYGDTNCDGSVDILDIITLNKALLGNTPLSDTGTLNADVDGDGKPTANDSLAILKFIVKILDKLPM